MSQVGGLDLIGKAAVLKTAGLTPLRVRVPHPPPEIVESYKIFVSVRRGDRVAEGGSLLSCCAVFRTEGSNPSLSASFKVAPSFNGRTHDSGSCYRGSTPWGAANL